MTAFAPGMSRATATCGWPEYISDEDAPVRVPALNVAPASPRLQVPSEPAQPSAPVSASASAPPPRSARSQAVRRLHHASPSPREHLLRTDLPAARHLGHDRTRFQRLRHDPSLVVVRPLPPPARPRQNLNPAIPATLRIVINVDHNVSPKLPAPSRPSTFTARARRPASSPRLRAIRRARPPFAPAAPWPSNSTMRRRRGLSRLAQPVPAMSLRPRPPRLHPRRQRAFASARRVQRLVGGPGKAPGPVEAPAHPTANSAIHQLSAHFAGELGFPGRQVRG